jgi:hypothetical protein
MPNWCECRCTVNGPGEDIQDFKTRLIRVDEEDNELLVFDFDAVIPTPKEYLKDERWYDWHCVHWGTKWRGCDVEITNDEPLEFVFSTAWSFPDPIFDELAKQYPRLSFYCVCAEPDMDFGGQGYFNGTPHFEIGDLTEEICQLMYGCSRKEFFDEDDEDDEETEERTPNDRTNE